MPVTDLEEIDANDTKYFIAVPHSALAVRL
jgi:hypothetical protein